MPVMFKQWKFKNDTAMPVTVTPYLDGAAFDTMMNVPPGPEVKRDYAAGPLDRRIIGLQVMSPFTDIDQHDCGLGNAAESTGSRATATGFAILENEVCKPIAAKQKAGKSS
jgi:hypothetical protein